MKKSTCVNKAAAARPDQHRNRPLKTRKGKHTYSKANPRKGIRSENAIIAVNGCTARGKIVPLSAQRATKCKKSNHFASVYNSTRRDNVNTVEDENYSDSDLSVLSNSDLSVSPSERVNMVENMADHPLSKQKILSSYKEVF